MVLHNLHIAGTDKAEHIRVSDGRIELGLPVEDKSERYLYFDQAIVFPGLINSHDHLDFNLFPQFGSAIYNNYTEWGANIHRENKEQINAVLAIPEQLRTQWGIYKNLLSGITTVVNHGKKLVVDTGLINVLQHCHSIHSVKGEGYWKLNLNKPWKIKQPVVMHIGEGTDAYSQQEIDKVIRWNLFNRDIIGVHGVAMNEKQAAAFKALIWCPASNYFMFGKTARVDVLKQQTTILFGTDSTLTASWNIWEHLRMAGNEGVVTSQELLDMVTVNAAGIWQLNDTGRLADGQWADIVVAKRKNNLTGWDAFYGLNPADILLVLCRGNIQLFDAALLPQLNNTVEGFSKMYINNTCKYVRGNLPGLMKEICNYNAAINFPVTCD